MVEFTHVAAALLALIAAIAAACQNLFLRIGTGTGRPYDAVIVVLSVNTIVLVPVVAVLHYPDYGLTRSSWASFIAAGVLGTMLGRAFMFTSISRIGASRTTPIVASWALVATVLGVIILGESLTLIHGIGIVLIVVGVAGIAWETSQENPDDLPFRELMIGVLIPFGAAITYGWEPIFVNFGLAEGTPATVGVVIKTVAALVGFTLYLHWHNSLPRLALLRSNDMKWFVLAGLANTLFIVGYYVGLAVGPVNIVAPIIITDALFVVILSTIFMSRRLEPVTWPLAVAATVVVCGVLLITLYG